MSCIALEHYWNALGLNYLKRCGIVIDRTWSDYSQAAFKVPIASCRFNSELVIELLKGTRLAGRERRIHLCWVPGHQGLSSNEKAYALARKGADSLLIGPKPVCGISESVARSSVKFWAGNTPTRLWLNFAGQNHVKKAHSGSLQGDHGQTTIAGEISD